MIANLLISLLIVCLNCTIFYFSIRLINKRKEKRETIFKNTEAILKRKFFDGKWIAFHVGTKEACFIEREKRILAGDKPENLKIELIDVTKSHVSDYRGFPLAVISFLLFFSFASPEMFAGEAWQVEGMKLTKSFEGFRENPYFIQGVKHIGYGFNCEARPSIPCNKKMTRKEAEKIFEDVYKESVSISKKYIGEKKFEEINDDQKILIVDLSYNMGKKVFSFKKLKKAILENNLSRIKKELVNSKWYRQTKSRGKRLMERLFRHEKKV